MIRKTLILGILALLALAAAAPALTGLYLAREFDSAVARLDRLGLIHVVSSRFGRGWFKSRASIRLRLDGALCARRPCPTVTLHSVIHHGPIPFTAPVAPDAGLQPALGVAVTRIDPASLWPRLVFEPALAPLRLVTRVGFDGRETTAVRADGASLDVTRERRLAHVEMSALTAHWGQSLAGTGFDAILDWPQFKIVGENGGQLAWRGLHASQRSTQGAPVDASPGQQLRAQSLSIADGLGTSARLQDLVWRLQPLAGADNARFNARVAKLWLDNNAYGPFRIEGSAQHIEPGAWAALRARLVVPDDTATALDRLALYRQTLPRLLAGHPRIDIDRLVLTTPDGDIRAHLRIGAPDEPRPARLLADIVSQLDMDFAGQLPTPLARDITVQFMLANGRSPYAIAEADIDKALAELVDRGLIEAVDDGRAYGLSLRIEKGRLSLNGRNQPGWQAVVDRFEAARERL